MITVNNEIVISENMYDTLGKAMMYKDSSTAYEMMMNPGMEVPGRMNLLISLINKNVGRQLGVGVYTQLNEVVELLRSIDVNTLTSDDMFALIAHTTNTLGPIATMTGTTKSNISRNINTALKEFKDAVEAHNYKEVVNTNEQNAGFSTEVKPKNKQEDNKNENCTTVAEVKSQVSKIVDYFNGELSDDEKALLNKITEVVEGKEDTTLVNKEDVTRLVIDFTNKVIHNEIKNENGENIFNELKSSYASILNKMCNSLVNTGDITTIIEKELETAIEDIKIKNLNKALVPVTTTKEEKNDTEDKIVDVVINEVAEEDNDIAGIKIPSNCTDKEDIKLYKERFLESKNNMIERLGKRYNPTKDAKFVNDSANECATSMIGIRMAWCK